MTTNKLLFATALTGSLACGSQVAFSKNTESPNVIIIVADDMGYGALGAYGGTEPYTRTPNLDQFAKEGIRFTDGYVTASTSGPSRAAILTGQQQQRFGVYSNCDLQTPGSGVPGEVDMMPKFFKEAGYNTAAIGKWHGGKEREMMPLSKGFDEFYGFPSAQSNFFMPEELERRGYVVRHKSPPLYDGWDVVTEHDYLTYEFTDRAVDFIERNKDNKFMLYLAYNAVHDPLQAPEEELAKFPNLKDDWAMQTRAAMLHCLDDGIGQVMDKLKEVGVDDNTIIIFLSDNGGLPNWWEGNNGDLRGNKRERWEGGVRVAYMMRYPNGIEGGQVRNQMVSALDIMPTVMDVANIKRNKLKLDGESMVPLFDADYNKEIHDYLYWAGGNNYNMAERGKEWVTMPIPEPGSHDNPPAAWSVRSNQWKVVHFNQTDRTLLFDLNDSVEEWDEMDLAAEHPEIVADLTKRFKKWFNEVQAPPVSWSDEFYMPLVNFAKEK